MKTTTTLLSLLLLFLFTTLQAQTKYFVDISSGDDLNTGLSWDQAFENLQTALNIISDHDTIWVAQGTYVPDKGTGTTNDLRTSSFYLYKGVNIYGGFAGSETSLDQRDWKTNLCILSGDLMHNDGSKFTNYDDNAYHVLRCANQSLIPTIDGFIVQGGNADTLTGQEFFGAGMYILNANPIVNNCTFQNNFALSSGAGMQNATANPTIQNCYFFNNQTSHGSGMHNNNASPQIISCTFEKNSSRYGAGMYNINNSQPDIIGCLFTNNHADLGDTTISTGGGGIYNNDSNAQITNCTFLSNSADRGGGINNSFSTPIIRNAVFLGNLAETLGGGLYNGSSNANIANCSFSGNRAFFDGGAIYNHTSDIILTNSIIWNNNDQSGTGTALASIKNINSTPIITYCLIQNITTSVDGNIDGITLAGNSNYPDFIGELDPTTAPSTNGNLRVYLGSPLIDVGNDSANSTLTDPDGYNRINGTIDLGAYENPAANCPLELLLTNVYSPLKGTYEAVNEIELANGAWIPSLGVDLVLNAPEVILSPTTESELGVVFTVENAGCTP